jgi:hypothetical protein
VRVERGVAGGAGRGEHGGQRARLNGEQSAERIAVPVAEVPDIVLADERCALAVVVQAADVRRLDARLVPRLAHQPGVLEHLRQQLEQPFFL